MLIYDEQQKAERKSKGPAVATEGWGETPTRSKIKLILSERLEEQ